MSTMHVTLEEFHPKKEFVPLGDAINIKLSVYEAAALMAIVGSIDVEHIKKCITDNPNLQPKSRTIGGLLAIGSNVPEKVVDNINRGIDEGKIKINNFIQSDCTNQDRFLLGVVHTLYKNIGSAFTNSHLTK